MRRWNAIRGREWWPMLLVVAPFVLALTNQVRGHAFRPLSHRPQRPALAFEQYLVDLGEAPPSEELNAKFRFTNSGDCPVTIREWMPSCGCLQPQLRKQVYQPGESGEFLLRVQTANESPGGKEYTLTVRYDDVKPREVVLLFRVTLPENQVVVRPRALIFYQFGNQPITQEIVVTDNRPQSLDLEGARSSSPLVTVTLGESDYDETGRLRLRVKVTVPGNIPPGRREAVVTLFTNDPVYRELKVPLLIEGKTNPPLQRTAISGTRPVSEGTKN